MAWLWSRRNVPRAGFGLAMGSIHNLVLLVGQKRNEFKLAIVGIGVFVRSGNLVFVVSGEVTAHRKGAEGFAPHGSQVVAQHVIVGIFIAHQSACLRSEDGVLRQGNGKIEWVARIIVGILHISFHIDGEQSRGHIVTRSRPEIDGCSFGDIGLDLPFPYGTRSEHASFVFAAIHHSDGEARRTIIIAYHISCRGVKIRLVVVSRLCITSIVHTNDLNQVGVLFQDRCGNLVSLWTIHAMYARELFQHGVTMLYLGRYVVTCHNHSWEG